MPSLFLLQNLTKASARDVLNAESQDAWDLSKLCQLNDADLSKLFNIMLEGADRMNANHLRNIKDFFIMTSPELAYALHQTLSVKYDSLYQDLLAFDDFSSYILKVVINIKNTEVGGFEVKPD